MDEDDLYGDLYGGIADLAPAENGYRPSNELLSQENGPTTVPRRLSDPVALTQDSPRHHPIPSFADGAIQNSVPPIPSGETMQGSSTQQPTRMNVRPSDMPDEGKMFVGGLNWDTTDESLKNYFSQFGHVVHCTVMRDQATGRSRGFAFLTFADANAVNNVMVREHYLDGKIIDPKRAIPRPEQPKTDKLFVRNLPPSVTTTAFKEYWHQFGNVLDSTLMMDRDTGRHRGFGFVNFQSSEAVDRVLTAQPHYFNSSLIEVKRAQPRNKRDEDDGGAKSRSRETPMAKNSGDPTNGAPFDPLKLANFFRERDWGGTNGFNPMVALNNGLQDANVSPSLSLDSSIFGLTGMQSRMGGGINSGSLGFQHNISTPGILHPGFPKSATDANQIGFRNMMSNSALNHPNPGLQDKLAINGPQMVRQSPSSRCKRADKMLSESSSIDTTRQCPIPFSYI